MKWDYETFLKQPNWFIEGMKTKIHLDNQKQNRDNKKLSRK